MSKRGEEKQFNKEGSRGPAQRRPGMSFLEGGGCKKKNDSGKGDNTQWERRKGEKMGEGAT